MKTLTRIDVTMWPDEITWTFDDGSVETSTHDMTTPSGRAEIAARAVSLGAPATRRDLFELFGGRRATISGTGPIWQRPAANGSAPGGSPAP